ncbi:CTP synthase [Thermofilum pendens]|uniref:CTP synthase (glutamine hydrolyzing) n=1 Tax=Thermofilum pendens (strain DSM 2475 / Hrk 5) TaxID=368408 RepID=A1RZD1_THEPD|nr:CTP synthase [Thermofilum pendens]ABL78561.1 CTP synthase [Thermofilum pendens Hrk 5]
MQTRYVFVTGGVVSGLGKGAVAASIGKLMQLRGFKVDMIKIDPYLNVDPGTLNPVEHGEVFVCEEVWEFEPAPGYRFTIAEIDQDFGTYERFLDVNMHPSNNITSGQVYLSVILKERMGEYLGRTIQVIPHVTEEIKRRIRAVAERSRPDVLVVEVGGTVGDIEAMPFLEAIRQFRLEYPPGYTALVHVTLVPYLSSLGQLKTKPTQHSVKELQSMGLQPDVVIGRSDRPLPEDIRRKIALYSSVPLEAVFSDPDLESVYLLPVVLEEQGLGDYLCRVLRLDGRLDAARFEEWRRVAERFVKYSEEVVVAMPGKYTMIQDSYISINEALSHAGAHLGAKVKRLYIEAEDIEENPEKVREVLDSSHGILLTPGFGSRGVEGMIQAARYALDTGKPFLGICFGAQLLFVAFMRYRVGLAGAHSTEIDPETPHPVVDLLPEQKGVAFKGGTMRLGAHPVKVVPGTRLFEAYKSELIYERFRHRYHINPAYRELAERHGLVVSSTDPSGRIINSIEVAGDAWIVGVQFHPEFKSRPARPSPVYLEFLKAALRYKRARGG